MISAPLATLVLALAAMTPGVIACRGERLGPGGLTAAAAGSLTLTMMTTALLGVAVDLVTGRGLPALALFPISLVWTLIALWHSRGRDWHLPSLEWQALLVAAVFVAQGLLAYALSINDLADGSLRIHAWYNADWFKHLGHSYAIANFGVPARDIFGNARPLHYYWLSHILPGAGAAAGGDAWAALYTTNIVYGALLAITLYGVVRLTDASPNIAAVTAILATMICAPLAGWMALFRPGGVHAALMGTDAPAEPAFASLALYIPQHALALTLLLGWATLTLGKKPPSQSLRLLALSALATVLTVSALFGAAILTAYGLTELFRRKAKAIPELATMAIIAVLLVVVLGVVAVGNLGSDAGLNSSVHVGLASGGVFQRGIASAAIPIANAGLPVLIGAYIIARSQPADQSQADAGLFALAMLVAAVTMAVVTEVAIGKLVAHEMRLRVVNLLAVSSAIAGGWALQQARAAGPKVWTAAVATVTFLTIAAAPTEAIRVAWHANPHDGFSTIIPADDRAILAELRERSSPRDVVLQFPEPPQLSVPRGDDIWSAVLAGRTNFASPRAADQVANGPRMELAKRFFAGQRVKPPPEVTWVYLSRKLHPRTYEALVEHLDRDNGWDKGPCGVNACLFKRGSV